MATCSKCGCENPDASRFCRKCGNRLDAGKGGGPGDRGPAAAAARKPEPSGRPEARAPGPPSETRAPGPQEKKTAAGPLRPSPSPPKGLPPGGPPKIPLPPAPRTGRRKLLALGVAAAAVLAGAVVAWQVMSYVQRSSKFKEATAATDLVERIARLESFLAKYPGDSRATAAVEKDRKELRGILFEKASSEDTIPSWREFTEKVPGDEEGKSRLASLEKELSTCLKEGRAALAGKHLEEAGKRIDRALKIHPENKKASDLSEKLGRERAFLKTFLDALHEGGVFGLPGEEKDQFGNPGVKRNGEPTDPATGRPYEIWFTGRVREPPLPRIEFVFVPPGEFRMGSPEAEIGRTSEESPGRKVRIAEPFYLGKYEVTQLQWKSVMGGDPGRAQDDNLPVVSVSWEDCHEFLKKLNDAAGARGAAALEFRLPSEAEWEYACRAGAGTKFCSGSTDGDLGKVGWYLENSGGRTQPPGGKTANAWSIYDMHGNVWEWCEDPWHGNYSGAPSDGRVWTAKGDAGFRVVRGGCWGVNPSRCRSAGRDKSEPGVRRSTQGFRIVAVPP